ncbi:putative reverse transcriptase domain-containing protein [Tanacetum coccineum]
MYGHIVWRFVVGWQNPNNNNGWLDEDDDEEPEEDEADEDNDEEIKEAEDEEKEDIVAEDEILKDIGEVHPLGLMPPTIGTAMRRIRKLNEQMRELAKVDKRIVKKIDRSDLCTWMVGRDAMSLDGAVRECQADVSKVISMMESMSLEFDRVRKESRRALELVEWEARIREQYLPKNAAMADDDVEDDDVEDKDDMDDDAADPSDPRSSEPRGSPRDSYMINYSLLFLCRDRIMPHKQMSQAAIAKLVADEVAKTLDADRTTRNTTGSGGPGNCGPTQFHGKEGAIELCRWFKKIECTFRISECAKRNKVKFAPATLQEEFCPEEEILRMEDELRHLRLKDNDIAAYTNRFNELVLLCPDVVPTTKKKIGQYIKGLPSYIKGETYSSKPTTLNEAVRVGMKEMLSKTRGNRKVEIKEIMKVTAITTGEATVTTAITIKTIIEEMKVLEP